MKKFSKKSVMLFAGALMVCAMAVPSMASAASWSPLTPSTHVLDSSNLGFTAHTTPVTTGSVCPETRLHVEVFNASTIEITSMTFPQDCQGTLAATGCTVTPFATRLPWTATGISSRNVQIEGVHIDVRFETRPPAGSTPCAVNGITSTLTGTLSLGTFNNTSHHITFDNATGLTSHSPLGSAVATVTGTVRDTQQSLVLLP